MIPDIQTGKKTKYFFIILLVLIFSTAIYSRITGMIGKTNLTGGEGCTCHSVSASAGVTVSITGPDEMEVNGMADYQVEVTGGPLVKGGINIAASAGMLVAGDLLRLESGELTHQAPVDVSGTKVVFDFQYTAPASAGSVTLYATGVSADGSASSLGDMWNHAPDKQITITDPATAVYDVAADLPLTFSLEQNYPNPFNPATVIPFVLDKRRFIRLKIYDLVGQEVATLFEGYRDAGQHAISFNAASLNSGTYIYRLTDGTTTLSRKMLVVR
jgi:hypothetical protein